MIPNILLLIKPKVCDLFYVSPLFLFSTLLVLHKKKCNKSWSTSFFLDSCEGSFFCNNATWRAEGDHDMDFDTEKG